MQGRLITERQAAQRAQIQGEIDGLQQQRGELQSQLKALQERRMQLFVQLQSTKVAQRGDLEQRLSEIDGRSAGLDRRIESLNDQITEAMARMNNVAEPGRTVITNVPRIVQDPVIRIPNIQIPPIRRGPDMREIGGMMAAEAIILALIGITFWRLGIRRMRDQFDRMFSAQSQQLTQLQQAVDTVAVEVERISEAQRYVAKVITEGATPALSSPPDGPRRK